MVSVSVTCVIDGQCASLMWLMASVPVTCVIDGQCASLMCDWWPVYKSHVIDGQCGSLMWLMVSVSVTCVIDGQWVRIVSVHAGHMLYIIYMAYK